MGRIRNILAEIHVPNRFRFLSGWLNAFKARKMRNVPGGLCVLPWIHLNIMPDGRVLHCCMNPDYLDCADYLSTQTIEEIWNGNYMKSLRRNMINGKKPAMCAKCYEQERCSGTSPRLNYNRYFRSKLKDIPVITHNDGSLDKIDLRYWNFRFSNRCNYKCRTCGIESSTNWLHDAKKLGWLSEDMPEKSITNESASRINYMDIMRKHIDQIEEIYFVKKEPLLMDEHWQLLEMLDERRKYHVLLHYNSNLSILKYRNKNIVDY
ncbi:MAG TPA: twitch domain-containing radical SAM protein [Bacteroidales bacterium]|nr:twitch domain-containing radical SAM protein [Bacteroidales bacterium]